MKALPLLAVLCCLIGTADAKPRKTTTTTRSPTTTSTRPPTTTSSSSTTSTTSSSTSTTTLPIVLLDKPVVVAPGRREVFLGSPSWLRPMLRTQQGDNVEIGAVFGRDEDHYGSAVGYGVIARTYAQWGRGALLAAGQKDDPSIGAYSLPLADRPKCTGVRMVQDPDGTFPAGTRYAIGMAGFHTGSGGFSAACAPAYPLCDAPGPCHVVAPWPTVDNTDKPWIPDGTAYPVSSWLDGKALQVAVFIGDATRPEPLWLWYLDWTWPDAPLTAAAPNGELPTEFLYDTSGYQVFRTTDPQANNLAPEWAPGQTVQTWESVYGPRFVPNLLVRWRYLIDGVHCDAKCETCQAARGIYSAWPATPPAWREDFRAFCAGDIRLSKAALVAVATQAQAPVGTCAQSWATFGKRPTRGMCDPDGQGMRLCNLTTGVCEAP